MKFLLAKKIGMSQIFNKEGHAIPVTVLEVAPNAVTQIKTKARDGYDAVQVGYGARRNTPKPVKGQLKGTALEQTGVRHIKEFRGTFEGSRGDMVDVSVFQEGDTVRVAGVSKGKGFQGGVKRHGFHGAPKTHGTKHAHRQPGSIGAGGLQRVLKGQRMAGRMGGNRISVKNLTVVKVDKDNHLLYVKGAVPGNRKEIVEIAGR